MISVIVCSREDPSRDTHRRNIEKTIGCEFEYVRIDNRSNRYGICSAYNRGVDKSSGEIMVFVHEDVFFMEPGWGRMLLTKFGSDPSLGLIGVAGTQYLTHWHPAWLAAGDPFLRGRLVHELNGGATRYLSVFSWDKLDAEVVAVDGLFFAVRGDLFKGIRFDERTFDGFHFYDLDICMQIGKTHRLIVTWDILVKHLSAGNCDDSWKEAGVRFLEKYRDILPIRCVDSVPGNGKKTFGRNYDISGAIPSGVIA